MQIEGIRGNEVLDSRGDKTVQISIKTNVGVFSASAPNGKSTGKYEVKSYIKSLNEDVKKIQEFEDYFKDDTFESFDDLEKAEDILKKYIGGNTLFAFETCILKAIAKEKKKEIWEIVNPSLKKEKKKNLKFPRLVGNCIGGGKHSNTKEGIRKPDFQEFLLIPKSDSVLKNFEVNKNSKADAQISLKKIDENFESDKNDEQAWVSSLDNKSVLEILKEVRDNAFDERKIKIDLGLDIAASGFYKRKKYHYYNPKFDRVKEEQFAYVSSLIENFNLFYIEDPFEEDDFEGFSELVKRFPDKLIVGDDLTTTNPKRLEKAIKMKSINGIIIKPNQIGSLIDLQKTVELAKKNKIKTVFSHRSGETEETILADLAFGFQADFFKCGITGKEREAKIKRLIEIEERLMK